MKFDTCAGRLAGRSVGKWGKFACLCHRSELSNAEHGKCEKCMCWEKTSSREERKQAKLQWMKNQLGACNFENALGGLSWLTDWMTWLLDCWLLKRLTAPLTSWGSLSNNSSNNNHTAGETHVRLSENHAATAKKYIDPLWDTILSSVWDTTL